MSFYPVKVVPKMSFYPVKVGDTIIDRHANSGDGIVMKVVDVGVSGLDAITTSGHDYEMTWDYAFRHVLDVDYNPIGYTFAGLDRIEKESAPLSVESLIKDMARIIFDHDRDVIKYVKGHDGTLDRAWERATLGFSPEKEWYDSAMRVATEIECIT